jgi:hypothetical protein
VDCWRQRLTVDWRRNEFDSSETEDEERLSDDCDSDESNENEAFSSGDNGGDAGETERPLEQQAYSDVGDDEHLGTWDFSYVDENERVRSSPTEE